MAALRDLRAKGMDREALRYQAFCADRLVQGLVPSVDHRILDVLAGSGIATLSAAQAVGTAGRVTAVDVSEAMLARLESKIAQFGLANIDVHVMDPAHLDFRRDYFHTVISALGLAGCADPREALRECHRVLRPGGRLLLAAYAESALQPYAEMLRLHLESAGVQDLEFPGAPWSRAEALRELLGGAGFEAVQVKHLDLGYNLPNALDWWDVVEYGDLRGWIADVPRDRLERLRREHLADVTAGATPDGLRLRIPVHLVSGRKPARDN